jgi:hypothetical protein
MLFCSPLTDPLEVGVPALGLISLSLRFHLAHRASPSVDTPAYYDDVTTRLEDDFSRSSVLLALAIAASIQADPRCQGEEILVGGCVILGEIVHASLRDETNDKFTVVARHTDGRRGIVATRQGCLRAQLRYQQKTPVERESDFGQPCYHRRAWDGMRVCDVRPASDLVHPAGVLQGDSVAYGRTIKSRCDDSGIAPTDVSELAVLEVQEIMLEAELGQTVRKGAVKVFDDVDVGLVTRK